MLDWPPIKLHILCSVTHGRHEREIMKTRICTKVNLPHFISKLKFTWPILALLKEKKEMKSVICA